MTDLTSFQVTDLLNDNLAAYYNLLLGGILRSEFNNTETITATRELADADTPFQIINPSTADRTIELPPVATTNHPFLICNAGTTYNLAVKDDSSVTTYITLAPGQASLFVQAQGIGWLAFETRGTLQPTPLNYLINGGFDFAQRQAPGTLTTITDNKCSADRWRVTRENADIQYIRVDATGESGLTSKYYGQFKKITNAGKFHVCQILEGVNSVPLRSKRIIFQAKLKASSSKTIRMAILELQNAGTLDTIPATLITAFGADSTDPTLGANVAVITAAQSKSVTTSWQSFSVSVTVPSNSKNIICAIWSDADFAANDTLSIAEAGLFYGSVVQSWTPRLTREELALCQRHYFKTFLLDTAPAQNIGANTGEFHMPAPVAGANVERGAKLLYPGQMFATPTITTYSILAASAEFYDGSASAVCTATTTVNPSPAGVQLQCTGNAATAVGNSLRVHLTAEAEL